MAEQIDALLRKQLAKLVELAKLKITETLETAALKVTGTLELPSGSITEVMLKALAVTTAKIGSEAVTEAKLLKPIVEKLTHQYFTTPKGGGGLIVEETVTVPANTLVTWQAWAIAVSAATTEVGCIVKLLKNGSVVAEGGGQLQEEKIPSHGAGQIAAQYVQATAGTFTWKVELLFFGTSVTGEVKPGLLAFT